nr:uncharacterized protein LOC111420455 isoform X1 [Onthophagus taurus]
MDERNNCPDWLKENFTKEEALNFLKNPEKPLYSFLITTSKLFPWLTLSIKLEQSIKQYKIYKDSEDFYYFFETKKFDDLEDLIKNYSENNWNEILNPNEKIKDEKIYCQPQIISVKTEILIGESEDVNKPIPKGIPKNNELNGVLKKKLLELKEKNETYEQSDDESIIEEYCSTNLLENIKKMKREEAEEYLSNKEVYSYLIRISEQTGNKCLTLKTENAIQHFVIYSHKEQFYINYGEMFSSVTDLIETYSKNNWKKLLNSNCDIYDSQNNEYDSADHYQSLEDCTQNYMKTFTREEAEKYLSKLSVFSYLVRPSRNGDLSLSVKLKHRIYHYLIHKKKNYYYIYEWSLFPTISSLIKTYAQNDFEDLFNTQPKGEVTEEIHLARTCKEMTKMELMKKPYYSYVLRDSSNFRGCKCLSVKFPENVLHYIIFSSEKGFYIYKYDHYTTIEELIENYSKNQWAKLLEMNKLDKRGSIEKLAFVSKTKLKSGKDYVMNKLYCMRYFEK